MMGAKTKIVIFSAAALSLAIWFWLCLPDPLFKVSYSSAVYDRNGELLGARVSKSGEWRFPISAELCEKYVACLIAYEDRYFFRHFGVNPFSILRAARQNIRARKTVSGASTITMQTVRMARNKPRTLFQKTVEMILALRLELSASKREILLLYASHAPFGGNIMGLEAASWRYFGHRSMDLSWAEAALLAVLPNSPSAINVQKNRPALLKKRNALLAKMHEMGKVDGITYRLATDEPLPDKVFELPKIAPHLVSALHAQSPEKRHITTIDAATQIKVEYVLQRWYREFSQNKIRHIAALVFDVKSGETLVYCGNVNFAALGAGNQVDVIRAPRSSGSILKPFLYMFMLQEGALLPEMLVADVPITVDRFRPQNYNMQFDGAVAASSALSRSLNLPAVNMLKLYGVQKFLQDLRSVGFSTLNFGADHYGLTLILGGGEVNLWQTSAAYLRMAQSVVFHERTQNYERGLFDWGQFSAFGKEDAKNFNSGAAWQTLSALINVNRPEDIDWKNLPSMRKIAWKTGTSYGFRDAWAIGLTPEYVVGVWTGNADGAGRAGLTGVGTSAQVMFDIFNVLGHTSWFEKPASAFQTAQICKVSGHLAGRYCENTEDAQIIFAGFQTPACPYHTLVHLSKDERFRVWANCHPADEMLKKSWFVLPPTQEWFYKKRHPAYRTLPPLSPACATHAGAINPMEFIYPNTHNPLRLSKQLDGSLGPIALELAHRQANAIVYWHLNDVYLGATQYFHQMSVAPDEGRHTITVVDEWGNTLLRNIEVKR